MAVAAALLACAAPSARAPSSGGYKTPTGHHSILGDQVIRENPSILGAEAQAERHEQEHEQEQDKRRGVI